MQKARLVTRRGYLPAAAVIILALITLAVAFVIYFNRDLILKTKKDQQAQQVVTSSSPTSKVTATPSASTDETTNWKTYTNTKYKFLFKYPNNSELEYGAGGVGSPLYVDETSDSIIVQPIQGESSYFGFSVNPSNKSLGEIENDLMKDKNNTNFSRIKVGGYEAIRFNYYGSIPTIKVLKDGNEFDFGIAQDNITYLNIANKIISTFRFL